MAIIKPRWIDGNHDWSNAEASSWTMMIAGFGQAVCAPPRPAVLASHLPPLCEADGAAFAPNSWIHLLRQMIRPRKSKASTDQAVVCRVTNLPTLFFSQKRRINSADRRNQVRKL